MSSNNTEDAMRTTTKHEDGTSDLPPEPRPEVWSDYPGIKWHVWTGGGGPPPDVVAVQFRDGTTTPTLGGAELLCWGHTGCHSDIVRYATMPKAAPSTTPDPETLSTCIDLLTTAARPVSDATRALLVGEVRRLLGVQGV